MGLPIGKLHYMRSNMRRHADMDKQNMQEVMLRDLESIQHWLNETKAYVERGFPDHSETTEDIVYYYRYIRTVATSF